MISAKFCATTIAVTTFLSCNQLHAEDGNVYIGVAQGFNSFEVADEYSVSDVNYDSDELAITTGFIAGYHWSSNFVIELGANISTGFSFFGATDSYDISEKQILVGYSFDLSEKTRFVPMIGNSYWELEGKEGQLLNPGPEATNEISGNDFIYQLGLERSLSDFVSLIAAYKGGNYEFGDQSSVVVGIKFEF